MAVFAYRVARPDGSTVNGQLEADDEQLVRSKLEGQGFLIFQLQRRGQTASRPLFRIPSLRGFSLTHFLVFNQELLALIKAGLPVLRVWDLLIERAQHAGFQNVIRLVRQDIRGGASASEALAKHPMYFSELYIATIKAGEQSGNLAEVLNRFVIYLKLVIALRQKLGKAMAYPAFLVLVGVGVMGFLLSFVMPTFVSVYGESAKSLPLATQILIDMIVTAKTYVIPVSVGAGGLLLLCRGYYGTAVGRLAIDRLLLRTPVIGTLSIKQHTIQMARTLGTVLAGGTPLVEALHITRSAISNRYIATTMTDAVEEIREGATLAAALSRPDVFPKLAMEMLSVGEETGSLEAMLQEVAEFYEGDLDLRLVQLTTWIEPVLLLIMGIMVGAIVIAMYLPVFQLAGTV
ncbi:General secretion pathway protein F [Nitrospira sp. KM1]|uniref:type II secretion system F family protein n=1 Tax=Nitrospira sp. KM1 TaxID=1936990 RepID=UPI0013A7A93B|nr:type II secretion system F family protein [Nitrospira sp. KM1]BCA54073.1 General secretion pathway protein F [Nitrospira sp. KM1]